MRKENENMDNELKETLLKVADYNKLEKRQTAKTRTLSLIIGETIILFVGGLIYLFRFHLSKKNSNKNRWGEQK